MFRLEIFNDFFETLLFINVHAKACLFLIRPFINHFDVDSLSVSLLSLTLYVGGAEATLREDGGRLTESVTCFLRPRKTFPIQIQIYRVVKEMLYFSDKIARGNYPGSSLSAILIRTCHIGKYIKAWVESPFARFRKFGWEWQYSASLNFHTSPSIVHSTTYIGETFDQRRTITLLRSKSPHLLWEIKATSVKNAPAPSQ